MQGRVAFITGGAGGIGSASADRLLREGCNVVLADIDARALDEVVAGFARRYGRDMVRGVVMDVTDEAAVIAAVQTTVAEYGGLDVLVNNAGITSAAAVEDTTLAMWNRTMDILATGYFLVGREGYRVLKAQGIGGTRFARFPGEGEPRDIHDKLEDCGVIQQLTRGTRTVSPHIPWDKVEDYNALRQEAAQYGLSAARIRLCRADPAMPGRNQDRDPAMGTGPLGIVPLGLRGPDALPQPVWPPLRHHGAGGAQPRRPARPEMAELHRLEL
jgi:hypothetical protein